MKLQHAHLSFANYRANFVSFITSIDQNIADNPRLPAVGRPARAYQEIERSDLRMEADTRSFDLLDLVRFASRHRNSGMTEFFPYQNLMLSLARKTNTILKTYRANKDMAHLPNRYRHSLAMIAAAPEWVTDNQATFDAIATTSKQPVLQF